MRLRTLVLTSLTALTLSSCASSLRTRQEPEQARSSIAAVLTANGFQISSSQATANDWQIQATRLQRADLSEKRYGVEVSPIVRPDPVNNNATTLEERLDPSKFTVVDRTEIIRYQADIRLAKNGPERAVTVRVTGSPIPVSNKYREIHWKTAEPPSAHQVEESLLHALEATL